MVTRPRLFDPWQGRGASCARRRVLKKRRARARAGLLRQRKRARDDARRFASSALAQRVRSLASAIAALPPDVRAAIVSAAIGGGT